MLSLAPPVASRATPTGSRRREPTPRASPRVLSPATRLSAQRTPKLGSTLRPARGTVTPSQELSELDRAILTATAEAQLAQADATAAMSVNDEPCEAAFVSPSAMISRAATAPSLLRAAGLPALGAAEQYAASTAALPASAAPHSPASAVSTSPSALVRLEFNASSAPSASPAPSASVEDEAAPSQSRPLAIRCFFDEPVQSAFPGLSSDGVPLQGTMHPPSPLAAGEVTGSALPLRTPSPAVAAHAGVGAGASDTATVRYLSRALQAAEARAAEAEAGRERAMAHSEAVSRHLEQAQQRLEELEREVGARSA